MDPADLAAVEEQLGRVPRGVIAVGHRCPCGNPDVVVTEPRLPDGTPFPTTFYLTCPRAASLIGTLEGSGLMQEMSDRLATDPELSDAYREAHESYLAYRSGLGQVPEIEGISAGGMPDRVKCLHALVGQSLVQGPGVNPLGDEALARIGAYWSEGPCVGGSGLDRAALVRVADVGESRPGSVRVGAIDCGTNTIKLLVTDLDVATGEAVEVVRATRMVRLGQGVDKTGRLADEALQRAFAAIDEYASIFADYHLAGLRFCATSAARDAENSDVFVAGVEQRLGVTPEVIPGSEEAALSFDGATRDWTDLPAPVLVVDIGGGSTELILGDARHGVTAAHSMDIGSVRMTERHLHGDPPTAEQVTSATAEIDAALDTLPGLGVDISTAATVIGVAGTITTMAAMVLDLPEYDRVRIHHARLPRDDVHAAVERILGMSVSERRRLGFVHPGRADVIGAGGLILDRILARIPDSVPALLVSESDILDGIAWSLVARH